MPYRCLNVHAGRKTQLLFLKQNWKGTGKYEHNAAALPCDNWNNVVFQAGKKLDRMNSGN